MFVLCFCAFYSVSFFLHFDCLLPPQLSQLRGRDKNFTLLHALVEQIMLHQPGLAVFTEELAEFETVPGGMCSSGFDLIKINKPEIALRGSVLRESSIK